MRRTTVILCAFGTFVAVTLGAWLLRPDSGTVTSGASATGKPGSSPTAAPGVSSSPPPIRYSPGTAIPAAARQTCALLVSADATAQRQALTPEFAATAPGSGRLFPAGSTLVPEDGSWHQNGSFANMLAALTEPGSAARDVIIGFAQQGSGAWLVTFEEIAA